MSSTRFLVAVAATSGCAVNIHLEVGVRHDGNRPAVHGGFAFAMGGDSGSDPSTYHGGTFGGGFDVDQRLGGNATIHAAYLGGGLGPLIHGGRFTFRVGDAVKLGGGLAYPMWSQERETACFICKADRDITYTTSFGAVGLYVSPMADTDGPSVAGDLVFDLVY